MGSDEPPFQIVKNKNKVMFTLINYIVSYDVDLSGRWTSIVDHGHVTSSGNYGTNHTHKNGHE